MKFNYILPKAITLLIGLVFFVTTSIVSASILTDEKRLAWASLRDLTSQQFSTAFNKYSKQGYMMIDVDAYPSRNGIRYSMIWRKNKDRRGWAEHRDMSSDGYSEKWKKYKAKGFRPLDVEAYQNGRNLKWAGIWVENKEGFAWSSHRGLNSDAYGKLFKEKKRAGFRLADIEVYNTTVGLRYAAIWYKNTDNRQWAQLRGLTRQKYQQEVNKRSAQGMRVVDFESYQTSNGQRYAVIWERKKGFRWQTRTGRTGKQFANLWRDYRDEGYRLIDFERYNTPNGPRYAGIWTGNVSYPRGYAWPTLESKVDKLVEDLMKEEKLPGMTVAVTENGQLKLTKGYGSANTKKKKAMKYFHRSLFGSVTKAMVTGPAGWQLMKAKGIDPKKQTLYGSSGIFKNRFENDILMGIKRHNPTDDWMKWYKKITIQNLMDHRAGFNGSGDTKGTAKMFNTNKDSLTYEQVHKHFLRTRELLSEPGTKYSYSNHGFGLWTLMVPELSGKSYLSYVQNNYLKPLGLHDDILPLTTKTDARDAWPHKYDSNSKPVPMDFWTSRLGLAAGGFTSSAQDLARVMVHLEDTYTWQELNDMGWFKGSGNNLQHNGRLEGGTSFVIMFPKGYTSNSGRDLSDVHVTVLTNIWTSTSKLKTLAVNIANEVPVANIPETYDIWKTKQVKP
jgi:CubicO group peptidase (beta-lactamase class C family)